MSLWRSIAGLQCYALRENGMLEGKCHCGNITLIIPSLTTNATSCNCSICSRYAAIWGYFKEADVTVTIGANGMDSYAHGDKMINFNHCGKCGCITHYTSTAPSSSTRLAVNYRMFDTNVLKQLTVKHFDGANSWVYLD